MIEDKWYTVEEIAERLKVTDQTVRRWLKGGALVGRNFGGRTGWRIREADVNSFLEKRPGKAAA
jgi:excisionase family DNA binding protein